MEKIGGLLCRLRGDRTRQKVAEALGITEEALQAYEQGQRKPRDEVILRAAQYYGVSTASLLRARVNADHPTSGSGQ